MKSEKFIFRRIIAGLIDYFIILTLTYIYIYKFGELNQEGEYSVNGVKAMPIILFWFIYICIIETILGATFGNYIVKLNPIDSQSRNKITIKQSFLRHIVDPLDMFFFGFIGIILIKNSEKNQRLGDILAKTIVVKN